MIEMAEIFSQYKEEYLKKYGNRILPSHRKTINDIINCRTPVLGGNLYICDSCGKNHYSYHSCGNRHCPKCGSDSATQWVAKQSSRIPAVPCFLLTFTVPHELNKMIRSNQKDCYGLLFKSSSRSIKKLASDSRHLGAQPGMLGVLHTWGRNLSYHPHVHYLIPSGGINKKEKWCWTPYKDFFLPVRALSKIFRAKFRDGLKELNLYNSVPAEVWKKEWVVHSEPVGQGPEAIKYLSKYIYRIAITNSRILSLKNGRVIFSYKPVDAEDWRTMTLPVLIFMARFLQHVLPKGFSKVRYYGFLHQRCGKKLDAISAQLKLPTIQLPVEISKSFCCPDCGKEMIISSVLYRLRGPPY